MRKFKSDVPRTERWSSGNQDEIERLEWELRLWLKKSFTSVSKNLERRHSAHDMAPFSRVCGRSGNAELGALQSHQAQTSGLESDRSGMRGLCDSGPEGSDTSVNQN